MPRLRLSVMVLVCVAWVNSLGALAADPR
jgi:hypothetical protein